MSVEAINRIRGVKASIARKAVLTWLADHAGADLTCFPSVGLLSDETGATKATVRAALKWLDDEGHISIEHRDRESSIYTIVADEKTVDRGWVKKRNPRPGVGQEMDQASKYPRSGDGPPLGQEMDQGGSGDGPGVGQEMDPNRQGTTNEPPIEPAAARADVCRRVVDDDEFAKSSRSVLTEWTSTFNTGPKSLDPIHIAQAVSEYGVEACKAIIRQLDAGGKTHPPTLWLLERLERGDHKQQPMKRGRRERNDPVTDQEEMLAAARAMAADGWNVVTLP